MVYIIVKYGYSLKANETSNVAFFPLYPALVKSLYYILPIDYFYLGQIISWLSLFGALVFFYKLLLLDYEEKFSLNTLLYLLLFPWAFFLAAVYTESLFLLLVISGFYYARKQDWAAAGILGFFAALTRISGIFLLPALLWEYYYQNKKIDARSLCLLLIPAGLGTFSVYLKYKTGSAFAYLQNQAAFGRSLTFPLKTLWLDVVNAFLFFKHGDILKAGVYTLGLFVVFLAIFLLIKKHKEIRSSYLIFAWLSILLPLSTGTTTSIGRYILNIFPIFVLAALVQNKVFKYSWFILGGIFLITLTFSFVGWYFIV
jgi:Gpi18-like mannosyltransferase